MIKFIFVALLIATNSYAHELSPYVDYRIGTSVIRDKDGSTKRSNQVIAEYKKIHPCPSTGKREGACPGWALNHSIPLACGGLDVVYNLQWVPNKIKSCSDIWCIDRHERLINDTGIPDTPHCKNKFPIIIEDTK